MNVQTATTAELLAFFNANSPKPVARFSDRKTAERRVAALIAELPAAEPVVAAAYVVGTCPNCGATTDITCGTVVERNGHQEVVREHEAHCHGCGHEFNYDTGKPLKQRAQSQGAGVAASWLNPEVRAARVARHAVAVAGQGSWASVAKAFAALKLPSNKIIRTRAELVAKGTAKVGDFEFALQA
jgi:rubredoxin